MYWFKIHKTAILKLMAKPAPAPAPCALMRAYSACCYEVKKNQGSTALQLA